MTRPHPHYLRLAFDRAQVSEDTSRAQDIARVEAFFKAIFAEAPTLANEMSILVVTADDTQLLRRSRDDKRATYRDTQLARQVKTAFVYEDRICIYVGSDNGYDKIGTRLETVLAHELGHWLDGAGHIDLDKWPGQRQRAECVADVFAGLLHLRGHPNDKQKIATDMARATRATNGNPESPDYTVPALSRLLAEADHLDLSRKTLHGLCQIAQDITQRTYQQRGRKPLKPQT